MNQEKTSTAGQVMGIIGIVLGVISLIVAFIPCIGVVAFIPAGLALIFSIISLVQATNDYGSKGLGIGALIISVVAILVAALWLMVLSNGAAFISDKIIKNPEKFEKFGKEFEKSFKEEMEKENINIDAASDSLESALRDLEKEMDKVDGTIDEKKVHDAASSAAKAIKKATEGIKIKVEVNVDTTNKK